MQWLIYNNDLISGDKTLDGYQKKKYVCKLLFIFLLGHDIDFGHMEAVNLLSSNKYTEKQIVSTIYTRGLWKRITIFLHFSYKPYMRLKSYLQVLMCNPDLVWISC